MLILVEDKVPGESTEKALEEAIYYCDGLLKKNVSDVRIAVGYNGNEVLWRVRVGEAGKHTWEKFLIKGDECKTFPTPDLVGLIYRHIDCYRIIEDRSTSSKKALESCIGVLKNKFRQLSFIQNDNHTTIDFTIAFISLKSILEKHGDLLPSKQEWRWSGLPGSDASALKINIKTCVEYICDLDAWAADVKGKANAINLAENFKDVFSRKDNNRTFDFAKLIDEFRTVTQLDSLRGIYDAVDSLPSLHSSRIDLFGETYELLADKKTKAAFGQFFTGRHIIRPLIRILFEGENFNSITGGVKSGKAVNPKKICDPACGTGGFLTEAFKHINDEFNSEIDVNDFAKNAFFGYDIFPSNITKTKINLYLAGDGFSDLDDRNTLSSEIEHLFDYVITNPPYGKGEKQVAPDVISNNRLEVNFLIKIVQMLQVGGKALVILPDGIFEAPSLSPLREWLIKQCIIDKIIGLPKFAFAPYTKEKTYALFITKRSEALSSITEASEQHEKIWCYVVDNDGYANSDKRFPTGRKDADGRWLHDELSDWVAHDGHDRDCAMVSRWKQREQLAGEEFFDEWGVQIPGKKFGYISLSEILRQEFTTYPSVSNTDVQKLIYTALTPNLDLMEQRDFDEFDIRVCNDGAGNATYQIQKGNKWVAISESAVLKFIVAAMKSSGKIPATASDLISDDGSVKPEYAQILADKEVIYAEDDEKFINQGEAKVTRLLNLMPEKYFRAQTTEKLDITNFKDAIDAIEDEFNSLLTALSPVNNSIGSVI